jgi:hypothetical protein
LIDLQDSVLVPTASLDSVPLTEFDLAQAPDQGRTGAEVISEFDVTEKQYISFHLDPGGLHKSMIMVPYFAFL